MQKEDLLILLLALALLLAMLLTHCCLIDFGIAKTACIQEVEEQAV